MGFHPSSPKWSSPSKKIAPSPKKTDLNISIWFQWPSSCFRTKAIFEKSNRSLKAAISSHTQSGEKQGTSNPASRSSPNAS